MKDHMGKKHLPEEETKRKEGVLINTPLRITFVTLSKSCN